MDPAHQNILLLKRVELLDNMVVNGEVLDHLVQGSILTVDMMERLNVSCFL